MTRHQFDKRSEALHLAERYGRAVFDALMVASALRAGGDVLWSEDMKHGSVVDGRLRIVNPFRGGGARG